MQVVIDSHALFWFLTGNRKLSHTAKRHVETAEQIIVPAIVLMEILYLLEKNNLSFKFLDFLTELNIRNYIVYPLDVKIIVQTLSVDSTLEMHDRIIVSTASIFNAPLISKDREIKEYYQKTIW